MAIGTYPEHVLDGGHQLGSHAVPRHHRDLEDGIGARRWGFRATEASGYAQRSRGQLLPPAATQALGGGGGDRVTTSTECF